jgi:hypothetical protein
MSENRAIADVCLEVAALVNAWCDRRELSALREILDDWPLLTGLTDEWEGLAAALHSIAGMRSLPDDERHAAKRLSVEIETMLRNR